MLASSATIDSVISALSLPDAPTGVWTSAMFTCWLPTGLAMAGRAGGNRTPNLRFWRPPLCQLSYCPVFNEQWLRNHLSDDTCADGFAALANGEAQALLHRDRGDQFHHDLNVAPRHHHLGAFRQLHSSRHIGGTEIKLRPIALEEGRMAAP